MKVLTNSEDRYWETGPPDPALGQYLVGMEISDLRHWEGKVAALQN